MSIPFNGKEFTFTQPDGTAFQVRGWGYQHHAVFERTQQCPRHAALCWERVDAANTRPVSRSNAVTWAPRRASTAVVCWMRSQGQGARPWLVVGCGVLSSVSHARDCAGLVTPSVTSTTTVGPFHARTAATTRSNASPRSPGRNNNSCRCPAARACWQNA